MKPHTKSTKVREREVIKSSKKKKTDKPWLLEKRQKGDIEWTGHWWSKYISVEHALHEMNKLNRSVYTAGDGKQFNVYFKPGMEWRLRHETTKETVELTFHNNEAIVKQ